MATTTPHKKKAAPAAKPTLTKKQLLAARTRLQEINEALETLREEQLKIRNFVADLAHDGEEGAKTLTIDGIKFSVTRKINRTITREEAERLTQEHGELSLKVLRWKPELVTGEYRENAEIIDDYITAKPGPPEVSFK